MISKNFTIKINKFSKILLTGKNLFATIYLENVLSHLQKQVHERIRGYMKIKEEKLCG